MSFIPRRGSRWSARFPLGFALALGATLACGGGGGGGNPPTQPPPDPRSITFTAGNLSATNSIGLVRGGGTTLDTLVLELRGNAVAGLYGLTFDLAYPNSILTFRRASEGTLLATAGVMTSIQAAETSPGRLTVGLTRLGNVDGVAGTGVALSLEFSAIATGQGTFTFSGNQAFYRDGAAYSSLAWGAGSVNVTR